MKIIEIGNPKEVEMLLKDGDFLSMTLAELQREHAELIAFNTVIDRERNTYRKQEKQYKERNELASSLVCEYFMFNKNDPELTLKAMQRALIGTDN